MKIEFFLPLGPFSVNRMYYRDKRHKTQAYKDWELQAFNCLNADRIQHKLRELRMAYDPTKHCFAVSFTYHCPDLLNAQGTISSRVEDLSNVEKPLLDVLFLPKFHVQPFPYGCQNVNADDKHVLELTSRKILAEKKGTNITIELIDVPSKA